MVGLTASTRSISRPPLEREPEVGVGSRPGYTYPVYRSYGRHDIGNAAIGYVVMPFGHRTWHHPGKHSGHADWYCPIQELRMMMIIIIIILEMLDVTAVILQSAKTRSSTEDADKDFVTDKRTRRYGGLHVEPKNLLMNIFMSQFLMTYASDTNTNADIYVNFHKRN